MKKWIVLAVAIILVLPAMSSAGSATSRWDLTIGGQVKFDVMWADQAVNVESGQAQRASGTSTSSIDKYGALTWASGDTSLYFLVKGPDTWGAKTSAFIEGSFRRQALVGVTASGTGLGNFGGNNSSYGGFGLTRAFMKFDWPTFSLVIGTNYTLPGSLPCFCLMTANQLGADRMGYMLPQIAGTWQATKEFSVSGGVIAPYDPIKFGTPAPGIAPDDFARSLWPTLFTEFVYKTDALGKIGPWMLQFGLGGMYGKEKPIDPGSSGATTQRYVAGAPVTVGYAVPDPGFDDDDVDMWLATFKTYIPIIPEKAPGKMAGSLGLALTAYTGQNLRTLFAAATAMVFSTQSYNRSATAGTADFAAPVMTGGWGTLQFYWTDTLWSGFYYGQAQLGLSQARKATTPAGGIERIQNYVINLVYDPNPAIRFGIEYGYITSHYGANVSGLKNEGNQNSVHFGAQYFF
jgi:hypothetical protein